MSPCPNTSLVKTGTTTPVPGYSLRAPARAVRRAIDNAKALGESEAATWLATQSGCPEGCNESKVATARARLVGGMPRRRETVVFWVGVVLPLPLVLRMYKAEAVSDWEARYICAEPGGAVIIERPAGD